MTNFNKAFRFLSLVQERKRITIRRLSEIMDCDARSIYRMVEAAAKSTPVYLEDGVVIWGGNILDENREAKQNT